MFLPPSEGEPVPGDCSPKSDTTLKRSMSLCQEEENEKMPTYSTVDDTTMTTPLEEPSHAATPTPAIPVSASFDSSKNETAGSPESRTIPKEQQVKILEEDPEGAPLPGDHDNDEKPKIQKPLIGQKFQHYTRVPQLRKDVSNKNVCVMYIILIFVLGGEEQYTVS